MANFDAQDFKITICKAIKCNKTNFKAISCAMRLLAMKHFTK